MRYLNYIFLFVFWLLSSCAESEQEEQSNELNQNDLGELADFIEPNPKLDSIAKSWPQEDVIYGFLLDEYEVLFKEQNSDDCGGLELMMPPKEEDYIEQDELVFRASGDLHFILESGDTLILENESFDEQKQNFSSSGFYTFAGSVERSNYWEVFVIGYECHYTVLVNKLNGNTLKVIGRPLVSPDGQLVICGNPDIESGYTINGFDILEQRNGTLFPIGQLELSDWGPFKSSWKNDSVAIIEKGVLDENFDVQRSCVEMIFSKY